MPLERARTRTLAALERALTRRRLGYAWFAGGVLWCGWLASVLLGPGKVDLAGNVVGTDYLQFYAAGVTLRLGEGARLYDVAYQSQLQQHLIGPQLHAYHGFITPPFLAVPFVPLSAVGYELSFALWSALGLLGLWASLRALGLASPWRPLAWSLTWFPIFASVSFGQNSLLSLVLLSLAYALWVRERRGAAGAVASLLLYKPQLLLGVAWLWLLGGRREWPALASLAGGACLLAGLSFWLLPAASLAYVEFAVRVLPNLPEWQGFPVWHLHTVRGFWRLLLPGQEPLADALALAVAALAAWGFARLRRRLPANRPVLFAGAVCLTLVATPHAMIYDWALLLIPAVLLWRHVPGLRERWKVAFAAIWIVTFVSGQLTYAQLRLLPAAVQPSVPVLLVVVYAAARWVAMRPPAAGGAEPQPAAP